MQGRVRERPMVVELGELTAGHAIHLLRPAPQLRGCVRFYTQPEVKIQGPAEVFPVPARTDSVAGVRFRRSLRSLVPNAIARKNNASRRCRGAADP